MTEQGTIYIQGWSNGVQELSNFSDIYVSCKYGWKDTSLGTVTQTGTITNKSLTVADSFDFITFEGDSHTITATWDDEQYIGVVPVIYDVILTYSGSSPKLNKLSFDPTNDGWTILGDCETVDQGINSGYAIEFSNPQKEIHVETQTDKKAWSTTEPYFGTGVIADGAYYNGVYVIIDGTNHPGELSFSATDSWESSDTRKYSKQTSGSMFYMWDSGDITQCSGLNHYTWDLSDVYLCYDNTTTITIGGITYTKQNPGPQPTTYTVTVNVTGQGTVSGDGEYEEGTTATLEATPASGWTFQYWENNDSGEMYFDNPLIIDELYFDLNLTAVFFETTPSAPYSVDIITSGQGTVDGIHSGDQTGQYYLTAIPAQGWTFDHWTISGWDTQDNPLDTSFPNAHQTVYVYFVQEGPQPTTYTVSVNVTGQGTTTGAGSYEEGDQVTLTATPSTGYEFNSWQINGTVVETNSTYQFIMGNQDVTITAVFVEEAENHIYLCDNSGAHLAEMTNTGSTWSVSGAFTSGMYSIRATVEGEYDDAWFKFYQTSGDNRVFVGAGDDPEFEDIGTYIMIDDILTSFSLTEDQTTNYYVVSYENTGAMTVSMVDTIVNSYIGDLNIPTDTSDLTNGAGFITMTDVEACGYIDQTTLDSMSYIDSTSLSNMSYVDSTSLSNMSYVDSTSLSNMSYVDNSYLSAYMNSVVGDINAILQTI